MKLVEALILVATTFLQPLFAEITVEINHGDTLSGSVFVTEDCSNQQSIESFISMVRQKTQETVPKLFMQAYSSNVTTSIENDKSSGKCSAEFHYVPQVLESGEKTKTTMKEVEMRSALEDAFKVHEK